MDKPKEVLYTTQVCTLDLTCHFGQPAPGLVDFSAPFFNQLKNLVSQR